MNRQDATMSRQHKSSSRIVFPARLLLALFLAACLSAPSRALSREPISFVYSEWKPVFYMDKDRNMHGLFAKILTELFENRLDMDFSATTLPWVRSQFAIKNGKSDFTIMIPTQERLKYARKSNIPVYQFFLNIFTYQDHPRLKEIRTISSITHIKGLGLTIATNLGNGWHKKNVVPHGIQTDYLAGEGQLFLYLARKRADLVIDFLVPSLYNIRKEGLESLIEVTKARFGPISMHLMMSKKSKYLGLLPRIDGALDRMIRDGTMEKISQEFERLD